jgi:hypothetical protein
MNADRISRALSLSVIAAVAIAQLWPGLSHGLSPPIGWDHGSHLGKAILTWNHLLPSIRGWTDLVEAGVPLNTVYGPAGLIWVLLFRCFTTHLEWHQTYALAFAGFRVLVGWSVYRLARVAGAGRLGAVAAGLIALADQGTHSEGGWFYDVLFGVWPMSLAMCVLFFGVADLLVYVEEGPLTRKGRWARARAMLLLGAALFSHQMCLVAVVLVAVVLVIARTTDGRERPMLRETLTRLVPVLVIAGMIAAWWMLPMLGLSAWLDDHGQLATTAEDVGSRMARAEGIWYVGRWGGVFVATGIVVGLFSRGTRRTIALVAALATLVYTVGWFLTFDAARWLPPLGRIVYPRMMMIAKPAFFALAGVVVTDALKHVGPSLRKIVGKASGIAGLVATCALLVPFSIELPGAVDELLLHRDVGTTATTPEWNDFNAAWQWVRERPRDAFWRVAYVHDGTHLGQASPAYTDRPGHTPGVLVGEAFRNTPDSADPDALRAINVRYVVAFSGLPPRLAQQCDPVATFGAARVCELRDWTSAVVSDADGVHHPHVRHLEDARVVFDPDGARSVIVRRALAPGWSATIDGQAATITEERVFDSPHLRLMRIAVPEGAHEIVLSYRNTGPLDLLGLLATLLGLASVLVLTSASARAVALRDRIAEGASRGFERLPPRVRDELEKRWPVWAVVLPLVGVTLMIARNASGVHLAYRLNDATIRVARPTGDDVCQEPDANGIRCGSAPEVVVGRTSMCIDGRYHSCITAGPAHGAPLRITWDDIAIGGTLTLGAGISDTTQAHGEGSPVMVRARVDGAQVVELAVPNGRAWIEDRAPIESGTHDLEIEIESSDRRRSEFCFDAIVR